MPRAQDFDLAGGGFRLDLKTVLILLGLVGAWYDQRSMSERRAALEELRGEQVKQQLTEVQALQKLQQYDIGQMQIALASNGIQFKKGN